MPAFKMGTATPKDFRLGSQQVKCIYKGATKIWCSGMKFIGHMATVRIPIGYPKGHFRLNVASMFDNIPTNAQWDVVGGRDMVIENGYLIDNRLITDHSIERNVKIRLVDTATLESVTSNAFTLQHVVEAHSFRIQFTSCYYRTHNNPGGGGRIEVGEIQVKNNGNRLAKGVPHPLSSSSRWYLGNVTYQWANAFDWDAHTVWRGDQNLGDSWIDFTTPGEILFNEMIIHSAWSGNPASTGSKGIVYASINGHFRLIGSFDHGTLQGNGQTVTYNLQPGYIN